MPSISIRRSRQEDYGRILEFYKTVDNDYFPSLSTRNGGVEGHIAHILDNNGGFCLYEVDGVLKGVAGWLPLDKENKEVQFNFFAFDKSLRGTIAPYRMAKHLAEQRKELGFDNTSTILVRTWSKRSSDRLLAIGMKQEAVVEGDIIPERTSYYFRGNLDDVVNSILRKKAS